MNPRPQIELYPVAGKKSVTAANEAGFSASAVPALLVEGNNRAGLGYATAQAIAHAGDQHGFSPGPGCREKMFSGFWI
jgi:hypothetical protein